MNGKNNLAIAIMLTILAVPILHIAIVEQSIGFVGLFVFNMFAVIINLIALAISNLSIGGN